MISCTNQLFRLWIIITFHLNHLQQKIDDFESELQNAYNALSPAQQDKVDAKVEEVRDFVRDQIRRDVNEVTQEHLRQGDLQLSALARAAEYTITTSLAS